MKIGMRNVILFLILIPGLSYSDTLKPYEKGKLAGSLGFGAMTIDAYYEVCYSKGIRTDNNLRGINKLMKDKWGFTYSEIAEEQENRTGRNYREEAHKLVNTVKQMTGGCESSGMKKWIRQLQDIHEGNLTKFHSANLYLQRSN